MNPLIEQFERDAESFEEKFDKKPISDEAMKLFYNVPDKRGVYFDNTTIQSHYTQSLLNLINKMIEGCEGRKRNENPSCDCGSPIKFHSSRCSTTMMNKESLVIYNQCLSDTISQLREFRDYLLEELKK